MTFALSKNYHPELVVPFFYAVGAIASALLPQRWRKGRGIVAAYSSFLALAASSIIMIMGAFTVSAMRIEGWFGDIALSFSVDFTSALFTLVVALAVFVYFIFQYSQHQEKKSSDSICTALYLLSVSSAVATLAAADFFTLLFFWGTTLALLYLILQMTADETTAQKALVILGMSDFAMLIGIVIIAKISLAYDISMALAKLPPDGKLAFVALLSICIGALAKAGAMPFHNWIIASATSTRDVGTLIVYPAIIDKALGIYLLVRIMPALIIRGNFFQPLLLIIGGGTLIVAVFKALAQHNLKKLLTYHSVSQVGYMLVGLASFNPVGILGGIFHMVNNIVYKSGLFMGAGAVNEVAGTYEMSELSGHGGYARKMPRTFGSMLVSSLAISGIPPLNGFVSKWLIFQGLLLASADLTRSNSYLLLVVLFLSMLGSSLTLASFIKVIHSVFLTPQSSAESKSSLDSRPSVWLPQIIMALVSVILGVGATFFIGIPMLGETSVVALSILVVAIVGGVVVYQFKLDKIFRRTEIFFGGEQYKKEYVFSGANFYRTVERLPMLARTIYAADSSAPSDGTRDIKEDVGLYGIVLRIIKVLSSMLYYGVERMIYLLQILIVKITEGIIWVLRAAHTGEVYMYMSWYLVAAAILMWIFLI